MKTDIHPKLNKVVFVDSSTGAEFPTLSTLTSDKTKKIKGEDHYVIMVDISSDSHPFFTGKQTLVDTAGRVDKFRARQEAAAKKMADEEARQAKKDAKNKETPEEAIARKAKANTEKKEAEKAAKKKAEKAAAAAKKGEEKE
jgi:large subunit ribosomal protein L31